jgi:hypothetical protein
MGTGPDGPERAALLGLIEEDLPRLLPDLRVVDRGLALSRGRAELLLQDRGGRAWILVVADGRGDETLLAAVDALAFARANGEALCDPAGSRDPRDLAARVLLVAEAFSERALEALALLPERELHLVAVRRLESQSGERARLVRLEPASARPAASGRAGFLAAVPDALRPVAELLLRRLARLDAEVELSFAPQTAWIHLGPRELGSLDVHEATLIATLPSLDRRSAIRGQDDADVFLDHVVSEHLRSLDEGEGLARAAREPLLTPEELAAFRA